MSDRVEKMLYATSWSLGAIQSLMSAQHRYRSQWVVSRLCGNNDFNTLVSSLAVKVAPGRIVSRRACLFAPLEVTSSRMAAATWSPLIDVFI